MKKFVALILVSFIIIGFNIPVKADPSIVGPSGLFLIPNPKSTEQGHFGAGLYFDSYSLKRQNSETHNRGSLTGNYGVTDYFEIGFKKGIDNKNYVYDPSMTINMKYVFPDSKVVKVAAGALIETDNNSYSSIYMLAGAEVAYFGLGVNFGGHRGYPMNMAHFGAYNFEQRRPENFFFLAGAEFDMKIAIMSVEYNSDSFVVGFRVPTGEGWNFNIGYRSESDYDRLNREVLGPSFERKGMFLGITGVF